MPVLMPADVPSIIDHPLNDAVRWSHDPRLPGIEAMRATWVTHVFSRHAHAAYTVGVNDAGRGMFDCRGEPHLTTRDTLNLINPGDIHTGRAVCAAGWTYRNLYLDTDRMRWLLEQFGGGRPILPHFASPLVKDQDTARSLRRLILAFEQSTSPLEIDSCLLVTVDQLLARHATNPPAVPAVGREPQAVERAKRYLEAHAADDVSIATLAQEVGASPFHLIRAFHRAAGLPPHAYQTALRVQKAQAALRAGTPIAQAAVEAGFYDQSHLTRCFKRALGVTPGRYRASAIPSKTA